MKNKENFDEYMQLGNTLMGSEKYNEAIKYFEKAEKIDIMNLDVHLSKGIAYANLENYDEAKDEFEKALKIDKKCGVAYFHIGNIEILNDNKSKGIELYNNAIAYGYDNAQVYYSLGLMYEDNDVDLALRNYAKAIMKDHSRPDIRVRKIRLLIANDNLELALKDLNEMILANPDIYEGYHLKYLVLEKMNKLDEAQNIINEAISIFPDDPAFLLDNASLMITNKKYNKAIKYLDEIRNKTEYDSEMDRSIEMEKAKAYSKLEDLKKTCKCLEKAKSIRANETPSRNDPEATYLLMNCYAAMKDYAKTIEEARELKNIKINNLYTHAAYFFEPFSLNSMGKEKEAKKLYEESIEYYRRSTLKQASNVDAYIYRVMVLRELERYQEALELADFLVSLYDNLSEIHILKATILEKLGRDKEAKEERKKAENMEQIVNIPNQF